MVKVPIKGSEFYFDGFLLKDLSIIHHQVLKNNNLFVCIVDGKPGTGKSTMTAQCAAYLDPHFDLSNECFNTGQFEKALSEATPGTAIILDESFDSMNRRRSQSVENMRILSLLQTLRCKQLFIFLVVPSVYDLDKTVLLGLATMFIHCYRPGGAFGQRGFFGLYDDISLKNLWLYCRQGLRYSLKVARPQYKGRFTKKFPMDYDAYDSKKRQSVLSMQEKKKSESVQAQRQQRDKAILELRSRGMKVNEVATLLGVHRNTILSAKKVLEQEDE